MTSKLFWSCLLVLSIGLGCKESSSDVDPTPTEVPVNPGTPAYGNVTISTDKAAYAPGSEVTITVDFSKLPANAKIRYKYLNQVVSEAAVTASTWTWKAPATDFRGYLAEVFSTANDTETIHATIGVDVSSDWVKFPRYGFVSKFPQLNNAEVNAVTTNLNRHHINGIQFYDWHNKHHMPLPMNGSAPASTWKDIINRDIYFNTVEKYINSAHGFNMKAMQYNLIYGAWDNAEADGVSREWFVYKDNTRTNRDFHPLGAPFLSNIYLLDPSNTGWQQYLINQNKKVYQALAFDGFHMDQLGNRGTTYKYDGSALNLASTFKPFINAVKAEAPNKYAVLNAVAQYGQQGIAESNADFLYTEVWSPFDTYNDLANLIKQNNTLSNNTKNTVLAAYVNYDLSKNAGFFNTPSVLMTNAVIFAFGGSHLELGEHMLANEYFPNSNLVMKQDLKNAMVNYYDFLVAYQNILRDGGTFNNVTLSSTDGKMSIANWPASTGAVAAIGKQVGTNQVIHLINFKNAKTQNWRDNTGIQTAPLQVKDSKLTFTATGTVKKVWCASPDNIGGASRSLNFAQNGNSVSFTLPELQYWSMIVVEY
ncbi:cycloisomaltooligosaccharide glucanotransferase [Rufibacter hautae]|uniref:Cycloisomaltooligosaccharide glucanotransferase n=1 Tax=Rufibacter hautae TaxID=2595005 RepID=A0A5B6TKB3_9BACT|nr:cycloisomaltooligosaccharide glucanotransferase [Rufibacter hautae]